MAEELDSALQDIVAAVAYAAQRRVRLDIRCDADALELAPVGVAHGLAGEVHHDSTRKDGARHATVGATADKGHDDGLDEGTGVLGRALRAAVHQHQDGTTIALSRRLSGSTQSRSSSETRPLEPPYRGVQTLPAADELVSGISSGCRGA